MMILKCKLRQNVTEQCSYGNIRFIIQFRGTVGIRWEKSPFSFTVPAERIRKITQRWLNRTDLDVKLQGTVAEIIIQLGGTIYLLGSRVYCSQKYYGSVRSCTVPPHCTMFGSECRMGADGRVNFKDIHRIRKFCIERIVGQDIHEYRSEPEASK